MANLYNVPLKNLIQKSLAGTLTQAETGTITLDSSVALELQASASMPGILVIDRVDVNGNLTPAKTEYISFTGVSGSTVTGLVRGLSGTSAQGHAIGAIVELVPDVTWAQAINDVFTTQHNPDGTHKSLAGVSLASLSIATSNIDTFSFKNINAPEGFLTNGKIVPSVNSNNLTVALKRMDGSDATASNPIYVRIGDTVRTITSALSVTLNAGTNWLGAGSTELATREVDYFVYLSWKASTSEVLVAISRLPFANVVSDLSTTGTDFNGAVYSQAGSASTDAMVNIGRFAATLSAGAGFTWTVPSFTPTNLIQRPIYETRRLSYQPVYTGSGSMTYGTVTTNLSSYEVADNTLTVYLAANGTTGGVASDTLFATLPFEGFNTSAFVRGGAVVVDGGSNISGWYYVTTSRRIGFVKYDASNFGLGASRQIYGTAIIGL